MKNGFRNKRKRTKKQQQYHINKAEEFLYSLIRKYDVLPTEENFKELNAEWMKYCFENKVIIVDVLNLFQSNVKPEIVPPNAN